MEKEVSTLRLARLLNCILVALLKGLTMGRLATVWMESSLAWAADGRSLYRVVACHRVNSPIAQKPFPRR